MTTGDTDVDIRDIISSMLQKKMKLGDSMERSDIGVMLADEDNKCNEKYFIIYKVIGEVTLKLMSFEEVDTEKKNESGSRDTNKE